ncbi:LysR family transcriptional regulator [Aliiroseovarius sp.]|uniref:LysR family transcriptional regulator n=1 Tax=Aliiroseovarius sp. TaxID=1872442 RepID=UPI00262A019A|nr:LysR family transcriptional regulator [Aliiroseovarius sp.]
MDVRWLEDFLALVELRNFTRAADFRNVSQAAFSRRIQSLEQWVGTDLVVKGAVPVRLTEAGEQFREDAKIAVDRLFEARSSIRSNQFDVMSQARIAMPQVLARSEFKRVLDVIGQKHKSSFSVIVGNTNDVVARYLAGDADILFSHDCAAIPTHDKLDRHDRLVIRQDRFMPYATRDPVKREKFGFPGQQKSPFPLIAYSQRAYFSRLFEHVLERAGHPLPYKLRVQCDMSDVLKEVIVAGYGVGWLPRSAVDRAAAEEISPVGGPEWGMDIDICAFRPSGRDDPKITAIWKALAPASAS